MTVFLAVGSLVLFAAALVLAFGGGQRRGSGGRDQGGRPIDLVRGRDFFERAKRPEDT